MRRNYIFELIKYNLQMLSFKRFFIITLLFNGIMAFINYEAFKGEGLKSALDILFVTFAGPRADEVFLYKNMEWFLLQLIIMLFTGDFLYNLILRKSSFLFVRTNRKNLWLSLMLSLGIILSLFFIVSFLEVLFIALLKAPLNITQGIFMENLERFNNFQIIFWMWFLLFLSCYAIMAVHFLCTLYFRSFLPSLIGIIILQVITIFYKGLDIKLIKWLPGNQGIIIRHSLFQNYSASFSLSFSIAYSIILIALVLFIGMKKIESMDIYI